MLLSNNFVHSLLSLSSQVVILKVLACKALVAPSVEIVKNGHGEARQAVHVHLIQGEPRGGVDSTVICELHLWKVHIPIVLLGVRSPPWPAFEPSCGNTFHTAIAVRVVGACGEFSHAQALEDGNIKLGAEMEAVVRQNACGVAP